MHRIKTVLVTLSFAFIAVSAWSQFNANSPYSRFGIGDPVSTDFMGIQSMGGIGNSFADPYIINITNPASYGFLEYTAYDIGLFAKYTSLDDGQNSGGLWNGNLAYMSLAFPLSNPINEILDRIDKKSSWGMNFSLLPNSSVGYNIISTDQDPDIGEVTNTFSGEGGTFKFVWGNAYRRDNLSIGLNLAYAFGNISYNRFTDFDEVDVSFNNEFINTYSVSGFKYDLGLMYSIDLNGKLREEDKTIPRKKIMLGLRANTATSFSTKSDILQRSVLNLGSATLADTLYSATDSIGSGKFAPAFGFGATYYNGNKSAIGFNFDFTNWASFKNDANPNSLSNTYRVSLGGFLRPNYKSYTSYIKRIHYRYGLYYGTDPRADLGQEQITNYGLTFGLGLPIIYKRKISHANLGFELGFRGQNTPIKETFAKINFSFTFNDDEWFIKRKYD